MLAELIGPKQSILCAFYSLISPSESTKSMELPTSDKRRAIVFQKVHSLYVCWHILAQGVCRDGVFPTACAGSFGPNYDMNSLIVLFYCQRPFLPLCADGGSGLIGSVHSVMQ